MEFDELDLKFMELLIKLRKAGKKVRYRVKENGEVVWETYSEFTVKPGGEIKDGDEQHEEGV